MARDSSRLEGLAQFAAAGDGVEGDQSLDLRSRVRCGEVELLVVLPDLGGRGPGVPCNLGPASLRLDSGLLVAIPDERPSESVAPEQTDLTCAIAGDLTEWATPGEVGRRRRPPGFKTVSTVYSCFPPSGSNPCVNDARCSFSHATA
jgi:hypothetical protein